MTAVPDRIVFDAEPLIAHAVNEPGAPAVEKRLDAVATGDAEGLLNQVNRTEIRYTIARTDGRPAADEYLEWLGAVGVDPVDAAPVWSAAEYVLEHNPALGDAFALATAGHTDATLLIGGDDDYDGITDVRIERFRDGSAEACRQRSNPKAQR